MRLNLEQAVVCIIGLGYVGLPLAKAFSNSLRVIGFDTDLAKVNQLCQPGSIGQPNLEFTADPGEISQADFIIICVPTPVTKSKEPDFGYIRSAAGIAGQNLKRGAIVILESTVYPGVTEEVVMPILEKESGLKCGADFRVGYSPERINPGDDEHALDKITKVVAGMDDDTTSIMAELYRKVTPHIFKARDVKTAEAAKVIENVQRDLNIALMNELAIIFDRMGLSTRDVLDVAATKWNFQRYSPGLVGGHCIPVDPYYLDYRARELDYHPQVILAGRAINDYMPRYIAEITMKALNEVGKVIKGSRVLIMGLAYKENVADIRESPVKGMIKELKEYGVEITGFDPLLNGAELEDEFGIRLLKDWEEVKKIKADGIILAVAHSPFCKLKLSDLKQVQNSSPVLIDVRQVFDAEEAKRAGFYYKTL
ncbi:MAG TPA: nucleotide sugar dehydrogenase [Dehalococcoidales bacterium]|nr:nucleotide sugar dehydrogenase [Dehalococcoidales bacterium]